MKDLTKGSILKNLIKLSLPIMFSNFMQTVYNLTDAYWLGKLPNARDAISVVGVAYPLVFFLSSFGSGFVVAGTSLVSRLKGSGNSKYNRTITGQFFIIFILFSVIFISLSTFLMNPILNVLNTPLAILENTKNYIQIIMIGMMCMYFFLFYQSFSFALGDSFNPMIIQVISLVINIVVDPLLIFGFKNIPAMGITGAAYATLFSRLLTVILAIIIFNKKYHFMIPKLKNFQPDLKLLKEIITIALPESISRSMTSFGFFILQGFVNSFGTVIISVYSMGLRVTSIFMMPAFGISSALTSILGQNLGAGNIERANKSIKLSIILINSIMFVGCLSLIFLGGDIVKLFINDPEVVLMSTRMFKITPYATFMFGMIFVYNGVFNSTGKTTYNMILSLIRLWVLRIPITIGLSYIVKPYGHEALWWAMIVSNAINLIAAIYLFNKGTWKESKLFKN